MAEFVITGPDGKEYEVTAPDDATEDDVLAYVQQQIATPEPPSEPQRIESNTLAGAAGMLARGATLGFGDEISGAADAVLQKIRGDGRPIGELYRERQQLYDRSTDQFAAENPLTAGALEAAGAALPAGGAIARGGAMLAEPVGNALTRVGRAIGLGGASGGLAGYGNADPGERAEGSAVGAAVGAATGGAVGGLVEGLSPMAQKLREPTRKMIDYVNEMVTGRTPAPRPITPPPTTATTAQSKILQAIERDRMTPAQVADRMSEQQQLGKPAGIIDASGENVRGLGRATVTLPGPGRQTGVEALNARADGQRGRVLADAERGIGVPSQDVGELSRQIIDRRTAQARPAYAKAEAQGELTHPDLIEIMDQNPAFAQAHNKARKLLAGANKDIPELFNADNNQLVRYPTVADVDLIKKGLDRRLYNNKRGANDADEPALDKYFAGVLEGERTRLLQVADELAPDYRAARAQFSGETSLNEALEAGQDLFNADPRQVTRALSEMTEGEREMFRTGALDSIRKRILSAADNAERANVVKSIFGFGKGGRSELMQTLFESPEDFARFQAQMQAEINMNQTRQFVTGGSQTANKLAEAADFDLPVTDALVDVAGGNVKGGVMRLGRDIATGVEGRWRSGITEGTRSEVADELFNFTEADRAREFLRQLEQVRLSRESAMRSTRKAGAAASVAAGSTLGQ